MTDSGSATAQRVIEDPIANYPFSTVACFDPTMGDLPRRRLNPSLTTTFLHLLSLPHETTACTAEAGAVLIGASTGQGHLRTPAELEEWFRVAARPLPLHATRKRQRELLLTALLRPEDGTANDHLLNVLAELGYAVVFVRPGTNLGPNPSDAAVAENMRPIVEGAAKRGLAVGLYSISDVSGYPMSTDVAAELVAGPGGNSIVAIKVTEANYENSTLKFLDDPRLAHLKIVQGWDPHLARALQDGPRHDLQRRQRCGFTSGAMSFALIPYLAIATAAQNGDWARVAAIQQVVTTVFASMQDDPRKFADLQRAKVIMGLGQPITRDVTDDQVGRVFEALQGLPNSAEKTMLIQSLCVWDENPFAEQLNSFLS
ncbi:dihydrodipicolinate synthase family protein [Anatilimnocola sp. NA78]|uniref:dihydrodipicolinate synthase family protein n=1 Tax=Anatilimnocola sp. NA78 TaxID=3415683 RepID=UPI003CE544E5